MIRRYSQRIRCPRFQVELVLNVAFHATEREREEASRLSSLAHGMDEFAKRPFLIRRVTEGKVDRRLLCPIRFRDTACDGLTSYCTDCQA
jgi:hypothetical protein